MAVSEASLRVHRESSKGIRPHEVILRHCALTEKRWSRPRLHVLCGCKWSGINNGSFVFYLITFTISPIMTLRFRCVHYDFPPFDRWTALSALAHHTHTHRQPLAVTLCAFLRENGTDKDATTRRGQRHHDTEHC